MIDTRAPAELAPIVEVIGEAATLKLIEARGGTRLFLRRGEQQEQLVAEIGARAAKQLGAHFTGEQLKVPTAKPWRARVYRARGWSYARIALALGTTETSVWRMLHATGDTRQLTLALAR